MLKESQPTAPTAEISPPTQTSDQQAELAAQPRGEARAAPPGSPPSSTHITGLKARLRLEELQTRPQGSDAE